MGLATVVVRRLLVAIPMLLVVASIIFLITNVLPGDPARVLAGPRASEEYVMEVRKSLGLNRPLYVQYGEFMTGLLRLDLGRSFMTKRSVINEILERFPLTVELTVASMLVGVFFGIMLGMFSAYKQDKIHDHIIRLVTVLLYCVPIYILGGLAQNLLSVTYGIFPVSGRISANTIIRPITGLYTLDSILTGNLIGFLDVLHHLFLPAIVLGSLVFTIMCRISRANVLDELQKNYIVVARATGLPERVIILKHALRNALLPVITMGGLLFALLLGGAIITESIFSLPGLGRLLVIAAASRDLPLIRGIIVFYALTIMIVNVVIDIAYYLLDPRISTGAR